MATLIIKYTQEGHIGAFTRDSDHTIQSFDPSHEINAMDRAKSFVQHWDAEKITYGIYPFIWRKLRKAAWGGEIPLFNHDNEYIGEGTLFRYEPWVSLSTPFEDISWTNTIRNCPESKCGALTGDRIPVDKRFIG